MNTKINNLSKEDSQYPIEADVCIVGSGPAGLTIAAELAGAPFSVLVIESGSRNRESDFAASLNEIENVGAKRVLDQRSVRNRAWGGSSLTWSGRCRPLDPIDFQPRAWVNQSGWPMGPDDVEPYLQRSAEYLGLTVLDSAAEFHRSFPREGSFLSHNDLDSISWQFSRSSSLNDDYVRFGPRFGKVKAPNIRSLTNATVTEIRTSEDGTHVTELLLMTPERRRYRVVCRFVILCAGGIENARLLLASNKQDHRGVGNANDVVGRYLMDHARATLGTFQPESQKLILKHFGVLRHRSGAIFQRGLSLKPEVQHKLRLLNGAAWMTQHVERDDVWRALRSLGRRNGVDRVSVAKDVLRNADQILVGLWTRIVLGGDLPRRMGRLDLDAMIEQEPNRESRILLSDRTDALGMPLAKIDWRVGEKESLTAIRLGHAVNEALQRAGMPTAKLVDWVANKRPEDADFLDQAHPTGATRMSRNPRTGVVDSDCKVHGIDNLYVAGSSVFPTGGHANPTLMIVALSIRLAERIRHVLRSQGKLIHLSSESMAPSSATRDVALVAMNLRSEQR